MPPRRSLVAAACLCLLVARGHELVLEDDVRYRLEVQVDGAVRTATLHTGEPYAAASARFCTPGTPAALCSAVHDRLKAVGPYVPTVRAVSPSANPPGDRTALLLHLCARSGARRYLEIGCDADQSFKTLRRRVVSAVGVDPARGGTYRGTSDAYFLEAEAGSAFDVAFVDGLHEWEQALRDAENSLRHLAPGGVVVLHDMNPQTASNAQRAMSEHGVWNGDAWKAVAALRARPDVDVAVLDMDYGCALVVKRPNSTPLPPELAARIAAAGPGGLTYADDLAPQRRPLLNLIAAADVELWLSGGLPPLVVPYRRWDGAAFIVDALRVPLGASLASALETAAAAAAGSDAAAAAMLGNHAVGALVANDARVAFAVALPAAYGLRAAVDEALAEDVIAAVPLDAARVPADGPDWIEYTRQCLAVTGRAGGPFVLEYNGWVLLDAATVDAIDAADDEFADASAVTGAARRSGIVVHASALPVGGHGSPAWTAPPLPWVRPVAEEAAAAANNEAAGTPRGYAVVVMHPEPGDDDDGFAVVDAMFSDVADTLVTGLVALGHDARAVRCGRIDDGRLAAMHQRLIVLSPALLLVWADPRNPGTPLVLGRPDLLPRDVILYNLEPVPHADKGPLLDACDPAASRAYEAVARLAPSGCHLHNQFGTVVPPALLALFRSHVVWDYSLANLEALGARAGIRPVYVPLGVATARPTATTTNKPSIDVLFYGTLTHHRARVLAQLRAALEPEWRVVHASAGLPMGVFGAGLAKLVADSTLVLSLNNGFDDAEFKASRIVHAIGHGAVVVSEASAGADAAALAGAAVFARPGEALEDVLRAHLEDPALRDAVRARAAAAMAPGGALDGVDVLRRALRS